MGDSMESTQEDTENDQLGSSQDLRRLKPPNKKKHEEEIKSLLLSIEAKETEFKSLASGVDSSQKNGLRTTRAEKIACIDRLKTIETDIKNLTQEVTKKKASLDRLQSTLHYRSEDRIDESIRRLEHLLKVKNFKLSEEKKIVTEIDSLKRSKKVLRDFLAMKKEMDEMRDRQRRMREERDQHQKIVNSLRNKEEEHKRNTIANRVRRETLKKELDMLYETKRKLVQDFKQLEKQYIENKEEAKKIKRRESFRRKDEAFMEAFQKDVEEFTMQPQEPYSDEIKLCNALINYLQKFTNNTDADNSALGSSEDIVSPKAVGLSSSACAAELEEGLYVLKKKSLDDSDFPAINRKSGKRRPSKKGRKQSVTKSLTHTPQIFSQFASLNLNAPSNTAEIQASVEQLQARRQYYKEGGQQSDTPTIEEHHASDVALSVSDAGISLTESGMCEMSRQASNTESTENTTETALGHLLEELVRVSSGEGTSETMSEKSEDTLGRSNSNSDSTEHGQSEGDNLETASTLSNIPDHDDKDGQQETASDNSSDITVTEEAITNTGKISGHKVEKSKVEEDYEFDLPETSVS